MAPYYSFLFVLAIVALSRAIRLGDSCSSDSQCSYILNAECRDSVCQCISSTVTHENTCVDPVDPCGGCTTTRDCKIGAVDPYRMCVSGQCTCLPYYHWNGSCRRNKGLYEYCSSDDECYWGEDMVSLMTCSNFRCSCVAGYVPRGKRCVAAGARNWFTYN